MKNDLPHRVDTIAAFHQLMGLPKPEHPLLSLIPFEAITYAADAAPAPMLNQFYSIALKKNFNGQLKYGRQVADFDAGMVVLMAPGQLLTIEADETLRHSGWLLLVHPDFLWHTPLAKTIRQYPFFSYAVHEALHLSDKEETMMTDLLQRIGQEYHAAIDSFSQRVILAQLDLFRALLPAAVHHPPH
jgi:AraC family transcriptional activator of pobA